MGLVAVLLFMSGSVNSLARVRTSFSGDNSAGHYNGNLSLLRDEASARLTAEGPSSSEPLYTRVAWLRTHMMSGRFGTKDLAVRMRGYHYFRESLPLAITM